MTDVLASTDTFLSESTAETRPQAPAPAALLLTCRYCPETFEGGARYVQRGLHEKRKHPDEHAAAKAGVKPKVKAKKQTTPRPPKVIIPKPKRIPAGDSISQVVGLVGQVVGNVDAPMGRALVFSAPATGSAVDELVAGTVVDRLVIQKFAGAADKWEKVGGVIAFPVLIAVISRNPKLFNVLEDQLRSATVDVIIASIPSLEKKANREKKAAESLSRLGKIVSRYANTDDPIRLILEDIFGAQITEDGGEPQ